MSTILSIWKEKCDHSPEIRTFKALSLSTSFEKLESNLKKKNNNPYLPTLILKTMQSETHIFFGLAQGPPPLAIRDLIQIGYLV